jgi:hypothetical protein
VAISVGPVRSAGRSIAAGLLPLPEAQGDAMEALLTDHLAQAASQPEPRRPAPPPRSAEDIERALSAAPTVLAAAAARLPEPAAAPARPAAPPRPARIQPAEPAADATEHSIASIVRELAASDGATFIPAASLFRDFAIRCRQRGVASAHIDIGRFRRLFACEVGGLSRLDEAARALVEPMIAAVGDDVLAPYLALVVAAVLGEPMPGEEELARLYGSSSPSRIRRLLDHLERSGLIVVREEFGGERVIIVPGVAGRRDAAKAA